MVVMIASWCIGYYIVNLHIQFECINGLGSILLLGRHTWCFCSLKLLSKTGHSNQGTNTSQQCNKLDTSHRLIKKIMFHCYSLGLQRELHQNSVLFPLIPTNTYQHKFRPTHTNTNILPKPTNIHKHFGSPTFIPNSHSTLY